MIIELRVENEPIGLDHFVAVSKYFSSNKITYFS